MNMMVLLVICEVVLVLLGVLLGSAWTLLAVQAWRRYRRRPNEE